MSDKIGNFLTIIRNGIMSSKRHVEAPYSVINERLVSILKEEGFVQTVAVSKGDKGDYDKKIYVGLKYVDGESVIHSIKRVSKLSRRVYCKSKDIRPVIGGLGISILTTSKGLMTDKQARREKHVGGEIICRVW